MTIITATATAVGLGEDTNYVVPGTVVRKGSQHLLIVGANACSTEEYSGQWNDVRRS